MPFGRDLAQLTTRDTSAEMLSEVSTDAAKSVGTLEELRDIGIVRRGFEKVVAAVEASPSLAESTEPAPIDRQLVRTLRQAYQAVARLALLNESAVTDGPEGNVENAPVNFLEAEVVAIYW
ncbi:hypothetical protein [Brevibacterium sp. W7.2]|uniref:hypothetical protein n=1 Tax=Brevibacterium sp. W7.2 TaxID=2823518 RepID=UPI001BA532B9|nr:hypothetical protein [Brevibacterium sp. W7.2]